MATESTAAQSHGTTLPSSESVRALPVEELPTLRRMEGTTTMSQYVLEKMHQQYSDKRLVLQLQSRLAQQQPREQVHFLLKVLPPAMKDEYEKERGRGRLEGTSFSVGEIIQCPEPATRAAGDHDRTTPVVIASQHEAWQALCTVCLQRRHGWETQSGPVWLGPRRKALREQLVTYMMFLASCGIWHWLKWHRSLSPAHKSFRQKFSSKGERKYLLQQPKLQQLKLGRFDCLCAVLLPWTSGTETR